MNFRPLEDELIYGRSGWSNQERQRPAIPEGVASGGFVRVTHSNPCPICGKDHWCFFFADGSRVGCMRVSEGSSYEIDTGIGVAYVHWLKDQQNYRRSRPTYTSQPQPDRASPETRHSVYSRIFKNLSLNHNHLNHLRERGLDDDQIRALGYTSMLGGIEKGSTFYDIEQDYGNVLFGVPGFYRTRNERIWLAGEPGLLIPCRNVDGKIVGAQIRVDHALNGGKYKWLSATAKQRERGGVSSGTPIHVARGTGSYRTDRAWITEGILKADIAALKLGETVIGIAGVGSWKWEELKETLAKLNPRAIVIAFDADGEKNPQVRKARNRLAQAVSLMGYAVEIAGWDIKEGKGIDDLLMGGGQPSLSPFYSSCEGPVLTFGERRLRKVQGEKPEPQDPLNEELDLDALSQDMQKRVVDFALHGSGGLLIRATQGFGKTMQTLDVLDELWKAQQIRPVYAAPRHDLLEAVFHDDWLRIRPRAPRDEALREIPPAQQLQFYYDYINSHTEMDPRDFDVLCHHWKRADALGAKRWSTPKNLCVTDCEIGAGIGVHRCPWFMQFMDTRPLLMVQEHLFVPRFCQDIFKNNDLLMYGQPRQVLVIDEPSPDKFIEQVNITTSDLGRGIVDVWDNNLRRLLEIVRAAVESVARREPRTEVIGRAAMQEFVDHAGGTDQFGKLLEEVKAEAPLQHEYVIVRIDLFMDERPKSYQVLIDGKVHFIPSALASPIDGQSIWVSKGYAIKKKLPIASEFEANPQAPNPEEDIPLNFQTDLLKVLAREFDQFKSGLPYNSALVMTPFAIKPTIRLNLRRQFSVPDHTPIIFLDGQGDAELLSTLTGRTIQTWSASIQAGTRIIQVVDGQYGVTSLWDSKHKKPKRTLMRLLEKVVFPLAAKDPENTVIITVKKVADELREFQRKGLLSPRVAIAHYGNLEGTNDYENRRVNILLGTPQDNPSHLEQFANALFIDDEIPISMERNTVWKRYRYADFEGNSYEARTEAYADARVQMLARLCCEQELVQAAHRVRPIRHADREIYLITSLPIDDLPPTHLTTVDDLAQAVGGMPEVNRIDKRVAHEVFLDVLAGEEMVWSVAFKAALRRTFCNHVIKDIDSEDAKREAWCDFPNDSTIWRWLREFAQEEGLERTRVVIDRRHRAQGGGGTWMYVYHPEHLSEATVRAQFAPDLDIEEADFVWVEPDAYENAEKWPDEWGGDPTWVRRWDTGDSPPTDTEGNDGTVQRTED